MSTKLRKPPSYRLHKGTGQAIVTLNGSDIYLGVHGTATSREAYDRTIAQWYANGRTLLPKSKTGTILSVADIIAEFWKFAEGHYVDPDGLNTSELDNYRQACRPLKQLYGSTPARDFGPLALQAVRDEMVRKNWTRKNVNKQVNRLRSVFKWVASKELIPASVCEGLRTVAGLQPGRGGAKEGKPVTTVPWELVEAIKPFVSAQVWAMIVAQDLTGGRPGEVVKMRRDDIDMADPACWTYRPPHHKNTHRGHKRRILIGGKAQEVLRPFLLNRPASAFLFSPAEAEAARRAELHANRVTPLSCGNRPGSNLSDQPGRIIGECYTVESYRRAVARGCEQAFPPPEHLARRKVNGRKRRKDGTMDPRWETDKEWTARLSPAERTELAKWQADHHWHPHQLRHNAATRFSREGGIETACDLLDHKSLSVTQLYAERNERRSREVVALHG